MIYQEDQRENKEKSLDRIRNVEACLLDSKVYMPLAKASFRYGLTELSMMIVDVTFYSNDHLKHDKYPLLTPLSWHQ
jgi:hypothetical protein